MTLYLKYRPQTFAELDLESVRETLTRLVQSDSMPHAFLFAGPKGTGKTSAARILAKYLNCENPVGGEPCNKCSHCVSITKGQNMDVVELDAASNRGIDDIRTLREQVILAPVSAKKKIYIFDEAHMLTTEAANAFLKTLEEPPSHVVFVLATTDPQKLPATILSRLTTISFQKASANEIARQLARVAHGEKLKLSKEIVNQIAAAADGSFRDAVKVLESLILTGQEITPDLVVSQLSQTPGGVESFIAALGEKDGQKALREIENLISINVSAKTFIDSLIIKLRENLLGDNQPVFNKQQTIKLLNMLIRARAKIPYSPIDALPLEIVVIKWCGQTALKKKVKKANAAPKPDIPEKTEVDALSWAKIMSEAREKNATIETLLRAARPLGCDGNCLKVGVYYRFHKEQLESGENKHALEEIAAHILGQKVTVTYALTERKNGTDKLADLPAEANFAKEGLTGSKDEDIMRAAKEIFGA